MSMFTREAGSTAENKAGARVGAAPINTAYVSKCRYDRDAGSNVPAGVRCSSESNWTRE